jgi:hypothetical protein
MANKRTLLAIAILLTAPAAGRGQTAVEERPVPPPVPAAPSARQEIVAPGRLDSVVRLRDVQITDNELRGTLVSLTNDELRDVRLRVADMFLWRNERRPGIDDVSRTEEFIVRGPIPPRGAVAFTAPRTPPPLRSDGDYRTSVEATAATLQPVSGAQAPSRIETTPLGSAGSPPPVGTPGTATPPPVGSPPPAGTPAEP